MLTQGKRLALNEMLYRNMEEKDREKDYLCFIGSPFENLDEVYDITKQAGYHIIDCELFRHKEVDTEEFCELIDLENHDGFAFVIPRSIPLSICIFLYNFADHSIVSTDSGYSSTEQYISSAGKAWAVIMTPEDFENVELEAGWDRSKLTRALSDYHWLHDTRYDQNDKNNHPLHIYSGEALRVVLALDTGWRESMRLVQQQDFDAVVKLWNPIRKSAAFRLNYEPWSNDPTIRFKLMNAQGDLFVAMAQGAPVQGESEPFRAAYALLEGLVGCAPFAGDGNMRNGNIMLFNILTWAKKWLDHNLTQGFLPIVVGKSEDEIRNLAKQLQHKLAALSSQ